MESYIQENSLVEKWAPVLEHNAIAPIGDNYRKKVTAIMLENQQMELQKHALNEAGEPANVTGGVAKWDPVLIGLVRRAIPQMIAFDIAGVQPMTMPTGLVFALRARYTKQDGDEALFNEADTAFGGTGTHTAEIFNAADQGATDPGSAMATAAGEGNIANQMAMSIEKITAEAKTRQLKAEYSVELAQDMASVHGLDAETELANILATEIMWEINREFLRTLYGQAVLGGTIATDAPTGKFDIDNDSDGRWSAEKFKGLHYVIEQDANAIGIATRRGKGNVLVVSPNVASALAMANVLSYSVLDTNINPEWTQSTYVGNIGQRMKVYVDPYISTDFYMVGYKGSTPYDAGYFYCPYIPLQMYRAVDQLSFQPKIAFKTRYALVANPLFNDGKRKNGYYRIAQVTSL